MATKRCMTLEKIKFKVAREADISFELCYMQRTLFHLRINDKLIGGECRVMQQFVRLFFLRISFRLKRAQNRSRK